MRKLFKNSLVRTLLTGGVATLCDMATLAFLVQIVRVSTDIANIPSLMVGSSIQFLGNRFFAFDSTRTHVAKQFSWFAVAEFASFALNALLFHIMVSNLHVYYVLARPVGSGLVFLGFSYPLWRVIFRKSPRRSAA